MAPRVIAIVGPNEAGKSTLLDALHYLSDDSSTLPPARRSRTVRPSDDSTVVTGIYVLEEHEMQSFADMDLEELPRKMELSRRAGDTTRYLNIEPRPTRSKSRVNALVARFHTTVENMLLRQSDSQESEIESDAELREDFGKRLKALILSLEEAAGQDRLMEALLPLHDQILNLHESTESHPITEDVFQAVADLLSWIEEDDPAPEVRKRLVEFLPKALVFSEADRTLPSAFTLTERTLDDIPQSLQNLADMADLSLPELYSDIEDGNRASYGTRIRKANNTLSRKFAESWRQSDLSVMFNLETSTIYLEILQGNDVVTPIDERSAGLRMYVALAAFLARQTTDVKPIILIDEAETHLHIDAQADLVASFSRQHEVAKIVYTTHSPACLPSDLGTGVRAVLPKAKNSQESTVENSFWRNASGFTPLMIAMGAGASAFSTARYVVLAEGATEMLLLPSLIRAATGLGELPYQVAPGLSEISPEDYAGLDLEGARVAFLVDGDNGGKTLKKSLVAAGVAPNKVVQLGALMLEHLLDADEYKLMYGRLLQEWNPAARIMGQPAIDDDNGVPRPKQLESWARSMPELRIPGKRDVASYLAEHGKAIPSEEGVTSLRALHTELITALDIKSAQSRRP
ncbi:AAA family ATPase [Arthrobacter sp. zg-Y238]|nr:AAA family ATPase [Arthrobacter sp. zg-Y238]